ncbi:MAG: zf-HC2 domain-containing protein [Bacteroidia bacterium]|nr:zf-HC2 domain-containing protein [Bacteroidia bacterium]
MNISKNQFNPVFYQRNCLSQDELTGYANETLSPEQAHEVEMHLIDCPFCSDALDGLQSFGDVEKFTELVAEVNESAEHFQPVIEFKPASTHIQPEQVTDKAPVPFFARYPKYIAIAASLAILAFFSVRYLSPDTHSTQDLVAQYYADPLFPIQPTAGDNGKTEIMQMVSAFQAHDYARVISLGDQFTAESENYLPASIFVAQSLLEMGNYPKAIEMLTGTSKSDNPVFSEMAEWLLGKAYLKNQDKRAAKDLLLKISQSRSGYQEKAAGLLKELD